jgi:predicted outer membrane repeat protein
MKLTFDYLSSCWLSRFATSLALLVMFGLVSPDPAGANEIDVNISTENNFFGRCSFRQAIESHNTHTEVSDCAAGDGDDVIVVQKQVIILNHPVTVSAGNLVIKTQNDQCVKVVEAAYLTVQVGAIVTLRGIGFDANGSFQRSVIENDGATLNIVPSDQGPCRFSNEKKGLPVVSGGILASRYGSLTEIIGGDFVNSSASPFKGQGSKGGAINIDDGGEVAIVPSIMSTRRSGDVSTATFRTRFRDNTADLGGAIYVQEGGILDIYSSIVDFTNNRASQGGGAIFSNGEVRILPGTGIPKSASFANNQAQNGAAIYSDGGQLILDGVEFDQNESDNDGGAVVSNELEGQVASITNSYFHGNSAKNNGGAVYVVEGSEMEVRRSTFFSDQAGHEGGGVFANSTDTLKSNLKVVNSTFVGSGFDNEGVATFGGSGEVVFSTFQAANLASFGGNGQVSLSNSILRKVACGVGVLDDGYNLQYLGADCPNSIPNMNPALDPKGLADNGGPTSTIRLLRGSPAIEAIPYSECVDQEGNRVTIDQRGFPRSDQGDHPCDIGAYETQYLALEDLFAGTPGKANCRRRTIRALAKQYGGLHAAAKQLGYSKVKALRKAIKAYCAG